jgi:uncharacterized protein (TIGR02271 family)
MESETISKEKNWPMWHDAMKKEARGNNNYDLGEVHDSNTYYIHTQRGIGSLTHFYIPKKLFKSYDGKTVYFDVNEADAQQFMGKNFPSDAEYQEKYEPEAKEMPPVEAKEMPEMKEAKEAESSVASDVVERVPLMTERLDVTKRLHTDEVTITKIPYKETQTRDVDVMHEELRIEKVQTSGTEVPEAKKDMSEEVIRIPLSHEDVEVTKTPEVREELVIRKTPIHETRHISEDIRSEKFEVTDNTKAAREEEMKEAEKKKRAME